MHFLSGPIVLFILPVDKEYLLQQEKAFIKGLFCLFLIWLTDKLGVGEKKYYY